MLQNRVREVIASVFSVAPDELPERLDPDTVEGWTSLRQIQLMMALENAFGIEIDPNLLPALASGPAIVRFLEETLPVAEGTGR
ncbi:acyl carrier protein [Micromonospora sp. CPCC 205546]|uniref:acyl carrier protein n=1 Tax=Micromonospora sp. CPCC 205546 TaxID=3122397 RepID=UPI002FF2B603